MTKNQSTKDQLVTLARTIFELAKNESNHEQLVQIHDLALSAAPIFDEHENELHPDLGLNLIEFVRLKIDVAENKTPDFGRTYAGKYGEEIEGILRELEQAA